MFNKAENMLVQREDGSQAQLAMSHLEKHKLNGKPVYIATSERQSMLLLHEGREDWASSRILMLTTALLEEAGLQILKALLSALFCTSPTSFPECQKEVLKNLFSSNRDMTKGLKIFQ